MSASVAVVAAAALMAACSGSPAAAPAMHHRHASLAARTTHSPYLSSAAAEARALSYAAPMGRGQQVVAASMMTVRAASLASGTQIASQGTRASGLVWLIWMRGTYRLFTCIVATECGAKPHTIYWIAIDARTGRNYGLGWSLHYPEGPVS